MPKLAKWYFLFSFFFQIQVPFYSGAHLFIMPMVSIVKIQSFIIRGCKMMIFCQSFLPYLLAECFYKKKLLINYLVALNGSVFILQLLRPPWTVSRADSRRHYIAEVGWGREVRCCFKTQAQPVGGCREGSGGHRGSVPRPLSSPAGPEAGGPGGPDLPLNCTVCHEDHCEADCQVVFS